MGHGVDFPGLERGTVRDAADASGLGLAQAAEARTPLVTLPGAESQLHRAGACSGVGSAAVRPHDLALPALISAWANSSGKAVVYLICSMAKADDTLEISMRAIIFL